jgi:osmotically-inducible protein OsmY
MTKSRVATAASAVCAAVLALCCTGCPQMAIMTGATAVAGAAADDRSLEQQGADLEVKGRVERALLEADPTLASQVNVDVYLGRIMLTGVVGDWRARRHAADLARETTPTHEVLDDIEINTGSGIADEATNLAMNKELGLNLLADEGLASQSFQHRVVNGVAFIMGQAKTESQIDRARLVALQTPGITRVVSHILLRP